MATLARVAAIVTIIGSGFAGVAFSEPANVCVDGNGMTVAIEHASSRNTSLLNTSLLNTGAGYKTPVVYLDPTLLMHMSPVLQAFTFWHECAHHALLSSNERAADCFAMRMLARNGNWSTGDTEQLQQSIMKFTGEWAHLPDAYRTAKLSSCPATPAASL
jgi:hypothetical protein